LTPTVRLDKERVQLGVSVLTRKNGREAFDLAVLLSHENLPINDLLHRQDYRVRIRQQDITVHRILQRGSALKLLQKGLLRGDC